MYLFPSSLKNPPLVEREVTEAFYVFSVLGIEEQMGDFEGKEVDEFVVKKLLELLF